MQMGYLIGWGGTRSWIRHRNLLTNSAQTSLHITNTDRIYSTRIIEMDGTSSSGGGESDIRSIVVHNIHEADNIGRVQEGGTGLLMFGPITEYLDMPASEKDRSGLGCWTTMLLKGSSGVQTRIICGYNPCKSNHLDNSTSYSQQRRHQIWQGDHIEVQEAQERQNMLLTRVGNLDQARANI